MKKKWVGVRERKVEENRGRQIERVIPNDCRFHCSLALCHGGGSDRHRPIFVQISIHRVPHQLILHHIFTIVCKPPSCPEVPSCLSLLPHIPYPPALLTSNISHLITYSFTIIFQRGEGSGWVKLKAVCKKEADAWSSWRTVWTRRVAMDL